MSFNSENDNCLQHKDILNKLCRICGERAKRGNEKSTPKRCTDYHSETFQVFRLNTNEDNETCHPPYMCFRCFTMMKKSLRTQNVNMLKRIPLSAMCQTHSGFFILKPVVCAHTSINKTAVEDRRRRDGRRSAREKKKRMIDSRLTLPSALHPKNR